MSAIDALKWHESQFRKHWTEPRVEPLVMTDTEFAEFMATHCSGVTVTPATRDTLRVITVMCDDIVGKGETWKEAAGMAAAKLKLENE